MAGKGGGAWKVAYADFVTAMMAFFLVMWICGQDQKVKRSVSDYFSDPLGALGEASGKRPNRTGSIFESVNTGPAPGEEANNNGQGRFSHTDDRNHSPPTKIISTWLASNPKVQEYWKKQATDHREAIRWSKEVKEKKDTDQHLLVNRLRTQLETEMRQEIIAIPNPVHRDLLAKILDQVNWHQLAQDLSVQ